MWYQITDESQNSKVDFPFKFIPFLNQANTSVAFHYAIDEFESRYFFLFVTWLKTMRVFLGNMNKAFAETSFYTIREYEMVLTSFDNAVKVSI